jgi:hypothetical protein
MADKVVKGSEVKVGDVIKFMVEDKHRQGEITDIRQAEFDPKASICIVELTTGSLMQYPYYPNDDVTIVE